jgi:hypothetical protein
MRPEIMFMQCVHLVHCLSEVELTHRPEGPWNSGGKFFLILTKVLGSATSSGFEVQRNWSHPTRQLKQFVADILWISLLLPCDNVRCMVVNGNLVSRLIGVVGQALRFSGELPVAGTRQDGNAQRCGRELPSAQTFPKQTSAARCPFVFFIATAAVWLKSLLGCVPQSCPASCSAAHREHFLGSLLGSSLRFMDGWYKMQQ